MPSSSSAVTMHGPSTLEPSQSFAFAGPHADRELARLRVPGRHVVPDRPAENVRHRVLDADVLSLRSDHAGELELVIESVRVRGPRDLFARDRSRCRASPCSTRARRTIRAAMSRPRRGMTLSRCPLNVRKSRRLRGRSGASRRPPVDRAVRPPTGAPASMNATMSPSKPTSTMAPSSSKPTRGAAAGLVGHELHGPATAARRTARESSGTSRSGRGSPPEPASPRPRSARDSRRAGARTATTNPGVQ